MATVRAAALLLLAGVCFLQAQANERCSTGCTGSQPKDGFLAGNMYTYSLDGYAHVQLSGAEGQETAVKMLADVSVVGLGNCANMLKINSLQITGPNGESYQGPQNLGKYVRFTLEDGHLGSEICAEDGDSQYSLNIKRAVLSLLQTATDRKTEVDVFGTCPTSFMVHGDNAGRYVSKNRDLNACSGREQGKHDLLNYVYNPNAGITNTQLLQSNLKVDAFVKNGVLEKAEAREDYLFRPFSNGPNGAKAHVVTKLILRNTGKGSAPATCVVPKSMVFDNPHPTNTEGSNVENVAKILKTTCDSVRNQVDTTSAAVFSQLVRILRVSCKADIMAIYKQVLSSGDEVNKRVFFDGLFRAGSGDAIEVIITLIKNKELTPFQRKLALLSLSTVRHASSDSIKAVASLLDVADLPNQIYVSAGALAGSYCRDHACHGAADEGVATLSAKFLSKLGNCRTSSKKAEDVVVAVLKGIRNIQHLEDSVVDKLVTCASDQQVRTRVRVTALEAFAADPCESKLKQAAVKILHDTEQDSEVRIKAYLAMVNCPCDHMAAEIKKVLDVEPYYQVGSFITSSLRNLRTSTNPSKESARKHFGSISTEKKFPFDARKFSQNFETSYNFDTLGIASAVEGNVIYSQHSFLPRSGTFNLTAEVFGRTMNIFEFGARQGNLDRMIEEYFGPKGSLRSHTPQQVYDYIMESAARIMDKISSRSNSHKTKRDVQQQIANFAKKLKTDIEGYNGELDLDFYVKIFGSEAVFLSLGDEKPTIESFIDRFFDFVDYAVADSKDFSHDIRSHMLFLDTELAYPTSCGLGLKLNVVGATATKMTFGGNLDFKHMLAGNKNNIALKIIPSAVVEVSGVLSFDADVMSTGLKVVAKLYSSVGGEMFGTFTKEKSVRTMEMRVKPIKEMELLTVVNDIVFITTEKGCTPSEKKLSFVATNYTKNSGCIAGEIKRNLQMNFGVEVCHELSIPSHTADSAVFPLNGPGVFSVSVRANEIQLKTLLEYFDEEIGGQFKFEYKTEDEQRTPCKMAFAVDFRESDERTKLQASLELPLIGGKRRPLTFDSEYVDCEAEQTVRVALGGLYNDGNPAEFRAGYKNVDGPKPYVEPIFLVYIPTYRKLEVTGKVYNNNGHFTSSDLCITESKKGEVMSKLTGTVDARLEPNVDATVVFNLLSKAESAKEKDYENTYKTHLKIDKDGNSANTFLEFTNKKEDGNNFLLSFASTKTEEECSMKGYFVHGADSKSDMNRVSFYYYKSGFKYSESNDFNGKFKVKLEYPLLELTLDNGLMMDPKNFDYGFILCQAENKLEFELIAKDAAKHEDDFYGKFKLKVNGQGIEAEEKYDAKDNDEGDFMGKMEVMEQKFQINGHVKHKINDDDVDVGIKATFKQESKPDDIKFDVGFVNNHKLSNSHAKLAMGDTTYVDYHGKLTKGASPSGNLGLTIKDVIQSTGQFKFNNQDSKGQGVFTLNLLKIQRKLQVDVNGLFKDPNTNLVIDIYPNQGKDKTKITFSTHNKIVDNNNIESRNFFAVDDKRIDLYVKTEVLGTFLDGRQALTVEVSTHDGQSTTLNVRRDVKTENGITSGVASLDLAVAPSSNEKPYKLSHRATLHGFNIDTGFVNVDHHTMFTMTNGKDLDFKLQVKNDPKEDRTQNSIKGEISGSIVPERATFYSSNDYCTDENADTYDIKYHVKASYGDKTSANTQGTLTLITPSEGDNKYLNDFVLQMSLPVDSCHDLIITSKDAFVVPEADDKFLEMSSYKAVQVNGQSYVYEGGLTMGDAMGSAKILVDVPNHEKLTAEVHCQHETKDTTTTYKNGLSMQYGPGKEFSWSSNGYRTPGQGGENHIVVVLPDGLDAKKICSDSKMQKTNKDAFLSQWFIDVDGKKYSLETQIDVGNLHNAFVDIKASSPDSKPARFYMKGDFSKGDRRVNAETKVENFGDFNMNMHIDAIAESSENFDIKMDIHSDKLGLNTVHFEALNEAMAKGVKKIQFFATEKGTEIVKGLTTYQSKRDGNKHIMEGTGSVTIRGQTKPTSFKYIHEADEKEEDMVLNSSFGDKNIVIEHKVSTTEFKFSSEYCEQKKQCAHLHINHKFQEDLKSHDVYLTHNLLIGFDLRKLGFAPEFGLQTNTELHRQKLPSHYLDIHVSQDKSKYHFQTFAKPVKGSYNAAMTLMTPVRIVSLESATTIPEDGKIRTLVSSMQHETVLYFNKEKAPNSKTVLRLGSENTKDDKHYTSSQSFLFSTPELGKDIVISNKLQMDIPTEAVSYEMVLDIFKKKTQRVLVTAKYCPIDENNAIGYNAEGEINAKNIGFDITYKEDFYLSPTGVKYFSSYKANVEKSVSELTAAFKLDMKEQELVFRVPGTEVVNYKSTFDPDTGLAGTACFLEDKTINFKTKMTTEPQYGLSCTVEIKGHPEFVLFISGEPTKSLSFGAELRNGKEVKNLCHAKVRVEGGNLKPEAGFNHENIKSFVKNVNEDLTSLIKKASQTIKKTSSQCEGSGRKVVELLTHCGPDLKAAMSHYTTQFQKISDEIENDKFLQDMNKSFNDAFSDIVQVFTKIFKKFIPKMISMMMEITADLISQATVYFTEISSSSMEAFNKHLLPELTNIYEKLMVSALDIAQAFLNMTTQAAAYVLDVFEKHSAELKPVFVEIGNIFRDIDNAFSKIYDDVLGACGSVLSEFTNQITDSMIFTTIQEKIESFDYTCLVPFLREFDATLNQFYGYFSEKPADVIRFQTALNKYLVDKIEKKNVNDEEELNKLFPLFLDALLSLFNVPLRANSTFRPLPGNSIGVIPQLDAPASSLFNYLDEDIPDLDELIKAFWVRGADPSEIVPPYTMQAIVAGGQHLFTFDGRHMTFPGSCRYVLATDAVDHNFTMVLNMEKGVAKSVMLADKSNNAVEIDLNGKLTLNGAAYGFPLIKSDIMAWREPDTFHIVTKYGAKIQCGHKVDLCYFEVSGFYLGKLRGLLGDGNHEPFDDFRLPNGKISTSESEFGGAHALSGGCAPVHTVDHSAHSKHGKSEHCEALLGDDTTLSSCNMVVGIDNYRQACEHATQSAGNQAKNEACQIAHAYAIACRKAGVLVSQPDECLTCSGDGDNLPLDKTMHVVTPGKQADIILAVETTTVNEKTYKELVVPLMAKIVDELKAAKVDDVKVHLVGISPKQRHPIYHDIENPKLKGAKIYFTDEQRSTPREACVTTKSESVNNFLDFIAKGSQVLGIELGVDSLHAAYTELKDFHFRPKAVRTIIMVHSEACPTATFPLFQELGSTVSNFLMEDEGIVAHLIAPLEDLEVAGFKQQQNIVGFNNDHVFVIGDKKRGLSHPKLRPSLTYNEDQCDSYASESHGNLYSTSKFFSCNNNQRKGYIQLAAQTIVDSLTATTLEMNCTCEGRISSLVPKLNCEVMSRKDNRKAASRKK